MLDFINVEVRKPSEGQEVEVLRELDEKQSNGCRHEVTMTQFCDGNFLCDMVNGPGQLRDLLPSGTVTHWRIPDGLTEAERLESAQEAKRITALLESN